MLSQQRPDPELVHPVRVIVGELVNAGFDPTQLLLVGASCRDIIHSSLGYSHPLRGTEDWDFGLAVASWDEYNAIAGQFPEAGTNGLRRRIAGYAVDLTPFGELATGTGHVLKPPEQDIDVFGFADVFARADDLLLGTKLKVPIPRPEGYAALKMRSWLDRSRAGRGEYKDAVDVATAVMWFVDSPELRDWIYDDEDEGQELLEAADYVPDVAAAMYLGTQIQVHLTEQVA